MHDKSEMRLTIGDLAVPVRYEGSLPGEFGEVP